MTISPNSALDAMLDKGGVRLDISVPRATVTLERPEVRNAQTPAMWRALTAIGEAIPDEVRVVVVAGSGESFSAGLDRRMIDGTGVDGEMDLRDLARRPDLQDETIEEFQRAFTWLRDGDAISVAAVAGHAVGAGFQLALACDLRICAQDAQFAMREISYGIVPDLTGTRPLLEAVGYSRALELCATGRWMSASEAVSTGLASAVVPRDELSSAVDDLVAALTAPLPNALKATKRLLRGALDVPEAEQRRRERIEQQGRLAELAGLFGS